MFTKGEWTSGRLLLPERFKAGMEKRKPLQGHGFLKYCHILKVKERKYQH